MRVVLIEAIAGTIYLVTITVVGFRLLWLARRTRELPELLLGCALILGGTLGGPLEAASAAAKLEAPELGGRMLLFGKLFGIVALVCHVSFIRLVFRPHERWALALTVGVVAAILAGFWGAAASGAFTTAEQPLVCFWVDLAARLLGSGWLVFEGARYYGLMRRRMRVGLADAVVTNRFLLWTTAGVCSMVFLLTSVPPALLDPERYKMLLTTDLIAFSIAGIAVSVLYLLAFLPPAAFVRRLRAAA
jgi:hypothetical protein